MKYLLLISFFVGTAYAQVPDQDEFERRTPGFSYWLKKDPLLDTKMGRNRTYANYNSLMAITLHNYFNDTKSAWKVYYKNNYDGYGFEIPYSESKLKINRSGKIDDVTTAANFFIYKGDPKTGPRLILQLSGERKYYRADGRIFHKDALNIYYVDKDKKYFEEFDQIMEKLFKTNSYRFDTLEFIGSTYKIGYMTNIKNLNLDWNSIILEDRLKRVSYESSEGFVHLLSKLQKSGIGMKKGVLLEGPPGTGKTLLGQILISSIQKGALKNKATSFFVSARHLTNSHSVKILFEEARRMAPSIIFMEDIDLFGVKKRNTQDFNDARKDRVLNELLNAIDGVLDNHGLLVLGTTNRPKEVDKALLRSLRFGTHLYFGYPKYAERKVFFERFGKKKAVWEKGLTAEYLAGISEGLSGADIVELISVAKQQAYLADSWKGSDLLILKVHFEKAFKIIRQSQGTGDSLGGRGLVATKKKDRSLMKAIEGLELFESKL